MIGSSIFSFSRWIVDKIVWLHKIVGRFNIWLYRLLSGKTSYQLIVLIITFLFVFFALQIMLGLDNNFLFKGMTTYDYDFGKKVTIDPFVLKLIYIVGVSFFSGFLVMVLTNGVRNYIDKYIAGDVRYRFYGHILIFGYNDITDGVIENIVNKGNNINIVVVVENKVREVRETIAGKFGPNKNLFVLHGCRTNKQDLLSLYSNRAFEIFLIGENESNSDFKNLDCYNELRNLDNFSNWGAYIYLYLQEQSSITLINNRRYDNKAFKDISDDNHRLRIYNTDERWARRILVDSANKWPNMNLNMRNGVRITMDSDTFVHLVIFGMSSTGEVIATTAAKTCHHPNFVTKGIRTKITIIDENFSKHRGVLHGRYYDFMEMCHYTLKRIKDSDIETIYEHHPKEEWDFLDVEWELIETIPDEILLQKKLIEFANNRNSLLSVVVCNQDESHNVDIALGLPKIYFDEAIPIWLYTRSDSSLRNYLENSRYDNIVTWGMPGNYPTQELWEDAAAKHLNFYYNRNFDIKIVLNDDNYYSEMEYVWESINVELRTANIVNAAAIPVFVGSMRNWSMDNERIEISDEEYEVFAQLEHVRWAVCTLLRGYRPLDKETEKISFASGEVNYRAIMENLKKQFYNQYICKYEDLKNQSFTEINKEIIYFYKSIIYKRL